MTSHYLNQWWLVYWHKFALLGLNELITWLIWAKQVKKGTLQSWKAVSIMLNHQLPDSKVHEANMGPIWGRQDPGGPHVGHRNLAIWAVAGKRRDSFCCIIFREIPCTHCFLITWVCSNSLAPGRCGSVLFKLILWIDYFEHFLWNWSYASATEPNWW